MTPSRQSTLRTDLDALLQLADQEEALAGIGASATAMAKAESAFAGAVPPGALRLALVLAEEETLEKLVRSNPEIETAKLEAAAKFARSTLVPLLDNPQVRAFAERELRSALESREETPSEAKIALGGPESASWMRTWEFSGETFRPKNRFTISGRGGRILFDSFCDWEDYAFLIETFSTALENDLVAATKLAAADLLEIKSISQILERLEGSRSRLATIVSSLPETISSQGSSQSEPI